VFLGAATSSSSSSLSTLTSTSMSSSMIKMVSAGGATSPPCRKLMPLTPPCAVFLIFIFIAFRPVSGALADGAAVASLRFEDD
jgi:hypothetical protein